MRRSDAGVATLELVVIFPVLLLLLFGIFQGALYFHGRNVLLAAAEEGVRAARLDAQPDRAATAVQQARQFLLDTGELKNLSGLTITPTVDAGQVRITITARTVSLLPGVPGPQVSQTAAGSIERFTSPSQP
jgi:Flp pilus assembly protein TadG